MSGQQLVESASLWVTAAGLGVGALVLSRTGQVAPALAALMELLTAAGLLHLAAAPTLSHALAAGGILLVRRLATLGLRPRARPGSQSGKYPPSRYP